MGSNGHNQIKVTETEIKRETETTAMTETETTALNKTIPNYQRESEYKTPGVVFYLLSVQFISQNESVISII